MRSDRNSLNPSRDCAIRRNLICCTPSRDLVTMNRTRRKLRRATWAALLPLSVLLLDPSGIARAQFCDWLCHRQPHGHGTSHGGDHHGAHGEKRSHHGSAKPNRSVVRGQPADEECGKDEPLPPTLAPKAPSPSRDLDGHGAVCPISCADITAQLCTERHQRNKAPPPRSSLLASSLSTRAPPSAPGA